MYPLVECNRCGYSKRAAWPPSCYVLPSTDAYTDSVARLATGSVTTDELPVRIDVSWCLGCENAVISERIRNLPQLQAELAHTVASPERGDELQGRIWAERAIEWRLNRHSPPKCLNCGSTRIELLRTDNFDLFLGDVSDYTEITKPFQHPGCSGQLEFGDGAFLQWTEVLFYSPEGDLLDD